MSQLQELVDAHNTVILVEHDMGVVAASDWVIDLGPGGGDAGGRIVAAGTPTDVAGADGHTARYLAERLGPSRRTSSEAAKGRAAGREHSGEAAKPGRGGRRRSIESRN